MQQLHTAIYRREAYQLLVVTPFETINTYITLLRILTTRILNLYLPISKYLHCYRLPPRHCHHDHSSQTSSGSLFPPGCSMTRSHWIDPFLMYWRRHEDIDYADVHPLRNNHTPAVMVWTSGRLGEGSVGSVEMVATQRLITRAI